MADVDQSLVELFLRIGLTDQRAVNTAKSEAIAPRLKAIAEAAGVAESGCDHAMGVLLYDLASKHAKVSFFFFFFFFFFFVCGIRYLEV